MVEAILLNAAQFSTETASIYGAAEDKGSIDGAAEDKASIDGAADVSSDGETNIAAELITDAEPKGDSMKVKQADSCSS